jgi:hypothetical protein
MKTVQIYNPARDQWAFGSSLPLALGSPSVGVVNTKFYLCGGIVGLTSGNTSSQCFIYDSLADSWSNAMAPLPVGINHAGAASDGARYIYFMNGRAGKNVPSTGFDTNQRYDTLTDSWTLLAPAPVKRAGMGESVYSDGFIFVIGGESSWRPASASLGLAAGATFYRCDVYSVIGDVWNRYPNGSALPAVALQADGGGCTDLPLGIHGIYPALWTDSTKGTRQIVVAGGSFISGSENNASTFVFSMRIGSAALNVAPSSGRATDSWGPAVLRMSSAGALVDSAGNAWMSDDLFLVSPMTTGTLHAPAMPHAPLQQQVRWASPVVDTLEYDLSLPPSCGTQQDVMIRLHFVEHEFRAAGSRLFSVLVDGRVCLPTVWRLFFALNLPKKVFARDLFQIMLSRFVIVAEASLHGLSNALVVRELVVPRATSPSLRLALMRDNASIGNPMISAIEVFCAAPLPPSPPLQQQQSKAAKAGPPGPLVWLGIAAGYLALAIACGGY